MLQREQNCKRSIRARVYRRARNKDVEEVREEYVSANLAKKKRLGLVSHCDLHH
jgi:hypothetical protein